MGVLILEKFPNLSVIRGSFIVLGNNIILAVYITVLLAARCVKLAGKEQNDFSNKQVMRREQSKRRRLESPELSENSQSVSLWGNMPSDIGHNILEKLPELVEHIRFSATCKQWSMISKEYKEMCKSSPKVLPMLLVPSPDAPAKRDPPQLYVISSVGKYYSNLQLQLLFSRQRYCGSSHGWIAFQNRNGTVTLIYPFDKDVLPINLPTLRYWDRPEIALEVTKLVISPDSTPDNYTIVAVHEDMKELATIKSGEEYWTYIPPQPETLPASLFSDIAFYQGVVYAVSRICMVVRVDVRARPPILKVILPPNRKTSFRRTYLVESTSSELYMLQRCFEGYSPDKEHLERTTLGFNVFKIKLHEDKGVLIDQKETRSLNGDTFFVGDNTSIAIRANGGCLANSIYFMDDLHDAGYYKPSGPVDIGYYNVQDQITGQFYKTNPSHKKGVARPIWIMPRGQHPN